MKKSPRTELRQIWRGEWRRAFCVKGNSNSRPAHNRQARRNFWREEWTNRNEPVQR